MLTTICKLTQEVKFIMPLQRKGSIFKPLRWFYGCLDLIFFGLKHPRIPLETPWAAPHRHVFFPLCYQILKIYQRTLPQDGATMCQSDSCKGPKPCALRTSKLTICKSCSSLVDSIPLYSSQVSRPWDPARNISIHISKGEQTWRCKFIEIPHVEGVL